LRIIGLDLGEKRIGVAAADDRTRVAIPVTTVTLAGNDDLVEAVIETVREQGADEVVIGLPLSLSGALGPQGQVVLEAVERLRSRLDIPVHTWDERLTTVQARRVPMGPRRRKSARAAMAGRDAAAAAIMLQAFVDSRRPHA